MHIPHDPSRFPKGWHTLRSSSELPIRRTRFFSKRHYGNGLELLAHAKPIAVRSWRCKMADRRERERERERE